MPLAGAVGAISAANRRNRAKGPLRSTTSCRYNGSPATSKPQAAVIKKVPDISETASLDSKPSILSMFKSQVQETSGFFKKQKDALAEKMQKGLKMTSASGKKDTDVYANMQNTTAVDAGFAPPPTAAQPVVAQRKAGVNPAWISSLEQMGFESSKVQEAIAMVGGQPEQMDDLLQVLVAMHASTEPAPPAPVAPVQPTVAPVAPVQPAAASPAPVAKTAVPREEVITKKAPTPPPMPPMSAVGSADYEMAGSDHRFLGRSAVGSAEFELASDSHTFAVPAVPQLQRPKTLDPSTVLALQQMGFQPESIQQATLRVGPTATFEKLCDVLLAMGAPLSPLNSGGAASSTFNPAPASAVLVASPERTFEEEADMCSPNTAAALVAEIVNEVAMQSLDEALGLDVPCQKASVDEDIPELVLEVEPDSPVWTQTAEAEFISEAAETVAERAISEAMFEVVGEDGEEVSKQDLAKAVVASVIAGASRKVLSRTEEATQPKKMTDETPLTASPVKGGA